jgi:formylglycine-generating enzyme required for sulfatase activity/serine/threonine protein kinase
MFCGKCGADNPEGNAFCASCGIDLAAVRSSASRSGQPSHPWEAEAHRPENIVGSTIDKYHIVKELGGGAMGMVYLANHVALDQPRAVKILREEYAANKVYIARFFKEAKSVAAIDHPNIVRVYDAGESGGLYFFAMEFIDGENFSRIVADKGPLSWMDALDAVKQVLQAFRVAHAKGIIHRDIKPENIMRTREGVVKVADFGLAKNVEEKTNLTRTGQIVGTPAFMSPEQCMGGELDGRTDIYSLGASLYSMLCGKPMFDAQTTLAVLQAHCYTEPEPITKVAPSVPAALGTIIHKMLAKDLSVRYQNAAEILQAIADFEKHMKSAVDMTVQTASAHEGRPAVQADSPHPSKAKTARKTSADLQALGTLEPSPASADTPPPPPERKKSKAVVYGAVIALVIAVAVIGGFLYKNYADGAAEEARKKAAEKRQAAEKALREAEAAGKQTRINEAKTAADRIDECIKTGKFEEAIALSDNALVIHGFEQWPAYFKGRRDEAARLLAGRNAEKDEKFQRLYAAGKSASDGGKLADAKNNLEAALKIRDDEAARILLDSVNKRLALYADEMANARKLAEEPRTWEDAALAAKKARDIYDTEDARKLAAEIEKKITGRGQRLGVMDFEVDADAGITPADAADAALKAVTKYETAKDVEKIIRDAGFDRSEILNDRGKQAELYKATGVRYLIHGNIKASPGSYVRAQLIDLANGTVIQRAEVYGATVDEAAALVGEACTILQMNDEEKREHLYAKNFAAGNAAFEKGDYPGAKDSYKRALANKDTPECRERIKAADDKINSALVEQKKREEKEKKFKTAFDEATALFLKNKPKEALVRVREALAIKTDPDAETLKNRIWEQISARTNSIGMKFVLIPAGEFTMGTPGNETGHMNDESPAHRVRITKDFYMQTTEVTQGQWRAVMGENPSTFTGDDNLPVESVSWEEALDFTKKLAMMDKDGGKYRLPTEAEWEYACRAGSQAAWSFGSEENALGDYAWFLSNSDRKTHPVGQKKPNQWGLYDMLGNVWEWCADWYGEDYYKSSPADDPKGPAAGKEMRAQRGGSYVKVSACCRSGGRAAAKPAHRKENIGLRVVREFE